MMYSEFIEMSGKTEKYISYTEYSTFIEPIYTECELTKKEFIALMEDAFKKIVYPAVEKAIHSLSTDDKLSIIECCSENIIKPIEAVDFEARKIAYGYLKLYARL